MESKFTLDKKWHNFTEVYDHCHNCNPEIEMNMMSSELFWLDYLKGWCPFEGYKLQNYLYIRIDKQLYSSSIDQEEHLVVVRLFKLMQRAEALKDFEIPGKRNK